MLTIRRRVGESILLGESIEIQVLEIAGNRVKIGIAAPREVLVLRKELELTEAFNREAARPVPRERVAFLAALLPAVPAPGNAAEVPKKIRPYP